MAIHKIYALRDIRTEAYLKPMFLQNLAVLDRALKDAKNDENNLLCLHPEDYQVYALGEYDDSTGKLTPQAPEHLYNIPDIKE